jgi:hypothetical protein
MIALAVMCGLALLYAGIALDALTVENARLWLALNARNQPEPGDDARVIEGSARVVE